MTVTISGTTGIDKVTSSAVTTALGLTNWNITESAGKFYFSYGGVNKFSIDSSGNLIVVGNVTAYGTV